MRASSRAGRPSSPTKSCRRCASGSEVTSRETVERRDCDAVVLFGATGDLCYRKIYPALYQLVRRGLLTVPVIGVARQGWKAAQLAARVRESLKAFVPAADETVVARLTGLLRYVDGEYHERTTFDALRQALGEAQRPLHYLAVPASVQITMAERIGVAGRGRFYEETGAVRDVIQNHLLQIMALLTMEPPVNTEGEALRDEKVKVLKAVRPVMPAQLVRGQFAGYRSEPGVAADSPVETYAALALQIDSWRWSGVPFYLRAGKCLPVTATEVVVDLGPPPCNWS